MLPLLQDRPSASVVGSPWFEYFNSQLDLWSHCWHWGQRSSWHPALDPAAKLLNLLVGPLLVAWHRSVIQTFEDGLSIGADVLVVPEVEGESHRDSINLTKHRLNISCKARGAIISGQVRAPFDIYVVSGLPMSEKAGTPFRGSWLFSLAGHRFQRASLENLLLLPLVPFAQHLDALRT